jgi:hypothetical protein
MDGPESVILSRTTGLVLAASLIKTAEPMKRHSKARVCLVPFDMPPATFYGRKLPNQLAISWSDWLTSNHDSPQSMVSLKSSTAILFRTVAFPSTETCPKLTR